MSKGFWGVIIIVILIFAGIFALNGHKDKGSAGSSSAKPTNHIQGQGSTGVTLVEYGDFQCPFCGQYYPVVKQVEAKYGDRVFFQFRNYPLPNLHPNAFSAARAAEAADMQGKFWEMHDLLYETQAEWSKLGDASSFFASLAKQLKLDMTKFKKDYASSAANDRINADQAEGNKLGVSGTPTFFIDGKKIEVTQDPASFDKPINDAIANKQKN
jgi:protein-disulfide isomerase